MTVVDAGCGTGFQSFLHATAGARVIGFDVAEGMARAAAAKTRTLPLERWTMPFRSPYDFVHECRLELQDRLLARRVQPPEFFAADIGAIPLPRAGADHINCCGTTLSLAEYHEPALAEFARVLRPGGTLCVEVLNRWSLETLWPVVDALMLGRLGYELPLSEALRPVRESRATRAFGDTAAPEYVTARLFTKNELARELRRHGLTPLRWTTIHTWTNLLPSTRANSAERAFRLLAALESRVALGPPASVTVCLCRKD